MGERGQGAALQDQLWVSLHGLYWRQTGKEQRGQEQTLKWAICTHAGTNKAPRGPGHDNMMPGYTLEQEDGPVPPILPAISGPAAYHNRPGLQHLNLQKACNSFPVGLEALGSREGTMALAVAGIPQQASIGRSLSCPTGVREDNYMCTSASV